METEDQLIIQITRLTEIFRQEKLIEVEGGLWVQHQAISQALSESQNGLKSRILSIAKINILIAEALFQIAQQK